MKISAFKNHLEGIDKIGFRLPDGSFVPNHFHITEIGLQTKHSIDCGRISHTTKWAVLQIWVAQDSDHRLRASKLLHVINQVEQVLGKEDLEVEVEYQKETIGKYNIVFDNGIFELIPQYTDCLAKESCGIETASNTIKSASCCTPGTSC